MSRIEKSYLPALTGIRAIAAWMVFVHHFNPLGHNDLHGTKDDYAPEFLYRFFNEFHAGVTVFFVLSGFLICFRYYHNFQFSINWFKGYLKNRVARIYPMYFILTVFTFFLLPQLIAEQKIQCTPAVLFLNISFLRGFFQNTIFTLIGQGWSLTVEECFYFSAPVIFFIARKFSLWLQPLLLTITGVLIVWLADGFNFYGFMNSYRFMWVYTFFGRCFEFFCGIQLALFVMKGKKFSFPFSFTYTGIILFIATLYFLSLQRPQGYLLGLDSVQGVFLNNYILPICIVIIFFGLINEETVFKKVLATPFFEIMGKSSYIFYLIHMGVVQILISKFISDNQFLVFVLLNVVSFLLFRFIEDPLNHLIRRSDFLIRSNRQ